MTSFLTNEFNDILIKNTQLELLTIGWIKRYILEKKTTNSQAQTYSFSYEKLSKDIINLIMIYQKSYTVYGIGEQIGPVPTYSSHHRIAEISHGKLLRQHYFPLYFDQIYKNFGVLHVMDKTSSSSKKIAVISESNTSETIYMIQKKHKKSQKFTKCLSKEFDDHNDNKQRIMACKNYFTGYWVTLLGSYCTAPKILTLPSSIIIKEIKCGSFHSIFLDNDGYIYGRGHNKQGQLALDENIDKTDQILPITAVNHQKIIKVACGHTFTIIKNIHNQLIGFGANNYGQLGINNTKRYHMNHHNNDEYNQCQYDKFKHSSVYIPTIIPDILVDDFDVGFDFVLAQNYYNEHEIYVWGDNRWGQCGIIKKKNVSKDINKHIKIIEKPLKVSFKHKIKQLNCGSFHSILVSIKNKLYVFGDNTWNQCLAINKKNESIIKIIPEPLLIQLPPELSIKQIICGHGVTFIVLY